MKHRVPKFVVVSLWSLFLSATLPAFAQTTPVGTLIQKGDYIEAIRQLKSRLAESPKDAALQLKLGECYLRGGYHSQAYSVLSDVLRVKPEYTQRVATLYFNAAVSAMGEDEIRLSRVLFQRAAQLDATMGDAAAEEAFRLGRSLFFSGKPHEADARFSVANSFDEMYGKKISDLYFDLGNALEDTECLDFYRIAAWYGRSHNEEIGLRLLRLAKNHPSKEIADMLKSEASRYVDPETVESVFPSPSWKTIVTRSYIGKGVGKSNESEYQLPTVRFGKTVLQGDKLVVVADGRFKIWDAGWEEHQSRCELIVRNPIAGDFFYVQAEEDRRIVVSVQRYQ